MKDNTPRVTSLKSYLQHLPQNASEAIVSRLFGLCYAMDGGYKGWNPYIERHLAIFVNCF
jgi:hypothetical protein